MEQKIIQDLSCVIPTLGKQNLKFTLKTLLDGSYIPSEIIISLPINRKSKFYFFSKKTKIIKIFSKKGQVNQRIKAIKFTKKKYILQLDDDIQLHKQCLEILYKTARNNSYNKVFGPVMLEPLDDKDKFSVDKCGKIEKNGNAIPFKKYCSTKKINKTDWLPGGCLIAKKRNFITKNFYPFSGKAYLEDLFNSMERKKKNISHYVVKNSIAMLGNEHNNTLSVKELKKYIYIKYFFVKKFYGLNFSFFISSFKIIINNTIKNLLNIKS